MKKCWRSNALFGGCRFEPAPPNGKNFPGADKHHGPEVLSLNYSLPIVGRVQADVVCDSTNEAYCSLLSWSTMLPGASRL